MDSSEEKQWKNFSIGVLDFQPTQSQCDACKECKNDAYPISGWRGEDICPSPSGQEASIWKCLNNSNEYKIPDTSASPSSWFVPEGNPYPCASNVVKNPSKAFGKTFLNYMNEMQVNKDIVEDTWYIQNDFAGGSPQIILATSEGSEGVNPPDNAEWKWQLVNNKYLVGPGPLPKQTPSSRPWSPSCEICANKNLDSTVKLKFNRGASPSPATPASSGTCHKTNLPE